jgi:hypothetical protein
LTGHVAMTSAAAPGTMSEEPGSPIGDISRTTRVAFHDPATQIRLLRLDPSSNGDVISATLDVWDKDSAPSYNAISYVCGTSPARNEITVNGQAVLVRDNCFEALQQANLHFAGSYVWVDAICINQNDLAEKSAQVAIMREIYVKASLVLACIGPMDLFIQSIRALDGHAIVREFTEYGNFQVERSTMTRKWYPDGLTCPETRFPETAEDDAMVERLFTEWNELSLRPYFKRAWIVQELTGGKGHTIILCGQDRLAWNLLLKIGRRLNAINLNPLTERGIRRFETIILGLHAMVNGIGTGGHFTQYLDETWCFRCEDPRDRVFSVLSLVDWTRHGQTRLLPDYSLTPSLLAFQLMCRMVDLDCEHIFKIVSALDLDCEYSDAIRSELLAPYKRNGQWAVREQWSQGVTSAFIVQQDTAGQFHVDLKTSLARSEDFSSWLPDYTDESLAAKGVLAVSAAGRAFAFACESMRSGDILLIGEEFDLVLRACADASHFVVVGAAYTPSDFGAWLSSAENKSELQGCKCWRADVNNYEDRELTISLGVSRKEAFMGIWAREAVDASLDVHDVLSYMSRHAIGTVRKGAYVRDVTTCDWKVEEVMGPAHPMCPAHLSSELHRVLRNALWCTILLGNTEFVRTCKPSKSRTA